MPYDICLFDLDGTLTDPYEGVVNAFAYALEKLGISEMPDDPGRFIGPPLNESFRNVFGFSESKTKRAIEIFREYYREKGVFENEVYPGVAPLLELLRCRGVHLAVATSKYSGFAELVLEHFDLRGYFDFVSGDSYDGALSRGGKEKIIRIALDALDSAHSMSAVMVGDRKHDILGGREAGIDSIGILWGYGSRSELEQAGATFIVGSTDELRERVLSYGHL